MVLGKIAHASDEKDFRERDDHKFVEEKNLRARLANEIEHLPSSTHLIKKREVRSRLYILISSEEKLFGATSYE